MENKNKYEKVAFKSRIQKVMDIIVNEEPQKNFGKYYRVQMFFANKAVRCLLDAINTIISLFLITFLIMYTYGKKWGYNNRILLFIFYLWLFIDSNLFLLSNGWKKKSITSMRSIIDIVSTVPFIITCWISPVDTNAYIITNSFCCLRILRLSVLFSYIENELNQKIFYCIAKLLSFILLNSIIITLIQDFTNYKFQQITPFFEGLFFVMITISTIGYYSIAETITARVYTTLLIIATFIIIPATSSELISLLSSKFKYARRRYRGSENVPHVLLTGFVSVTAAKDFLYELYHPDHGKEIKHTVILLPQRPSEQMENLLYMPEYLSTVVYIEGSPANSADLHRCLTEKTKAIFILTNKQSSQPSIEDAKTILTAMAIKKYLKDKGSVNTQLYMQVIKPESIIQYKLSLSSESQFDKIICVEAIKLGIISKSCCCPGLISLLQNIIATCGNEHEGLYIPELELYKTSRQYEVYCIKVPNKFLGCQFKDMAYKIYHDYHCLMIGIEILDKETNSSCIILNPYEYTFNAGEANYGFLLATDKTIADKITEDYTDAAAQVPTIERLGHVDKHNTRELKATKLTQEEIEADSIKESEEPTSENELKEEIAKEK